MKHVEGPLIRAAAKVVCLTEKAASVLSEWYLADDPNALGRFQVVPCCADFSHFDPSRVSEADLAKARAIAGVSSKDFVLLYLGSLGPDYLLDRMMALFVQFVKERSRARFVFLSNNGEELVQTVRAAHGVSRERISFVSVDRDDVPAFLAMADASVIFIRADISKAGCSPTKLAELFACGVPRDCQLWGRGHGSNHRSKNERVCAGRRFLRFHVARGGEEDTGAWADGSHSREQPAIRSFCRRREICGRLSRVVGELGECSCSMWWS